MIARLISQGRKDGNPQFTVTVDSGEDAPFYEGKEIAANMELYRDRAGTIYAVVTIFEYVPPEETAVNIKAIAKR